MMIETTDGIDWQSADEFISEQTKRIQNDFKSSRPKPRSRFMGLRDEPKQNRRQDKDKWSQYRTMVKRNEWFL